VIPERKASKRLTTSLSPTTRQVPLWQHADIWPFELDLSRERDGDGAGCSEIALEAGENLIERAKAAGEQAMRVPILRRAEPRSGRWTQPVTLQNVDPLKVSGQGAGRRQPADPRANDNRPPAQLIGAAVACRR
jgi:hypothetical protein